MNRRRQQGLTLLEVMVAIAITAAIAAITYQSIHGAAGGAERSAEVMDEINRLDRTWQIIAADLRHALPPEPSPGVDGVRFLFQGESLRGNADERQLLMRFTRRGWINPMERLRSDIQELSYRVEDGRLWRYFRPARNRPFDEYDFDEQALRQELLDGIQDIQMRFLSGAIAAQRGLSSIEGTDYTRDWPELWPDPNQIGGTLELPVAVEIRIELEGSGVSRRLFEFAQAR
ncbi:type II secretion system minor pseudopilin GspJ [Marinimicrobium alkaliphilum]|uniref:type II secretion system minor pseudopilin GspJ n=1 Tax=Marinimicrobium alkaliphilum TaxID=2202654 RepID=UPI000DBAD8CF|nr:type II secretion system minor pseudopilin GspJ [Marinimicrobium alkaliphilum]